MNQADKLYPSLALTVDRDFWEKMAVATSVEYADSYLSGAELYNGRLLPRTVTAWERLKDSWAARKVLSDAGVSLIKPPPYSKTQLLQLPR
jgi:hypothetical protein